VFSSVGMMCKFSRRVALSDWGRPWSVSATRWRKQVQSLPTRLWLSHRSHLPTAMVIIWWKIMISVVCWC